LPDYEFVSEHLPSRVVLLAKKKFKIDSKDGVDWNIWIDFNKWSSLVKEGRDSISFEEYSTKMPRQFIGLKITELTPMSEDREKHLAEMKVLIGKEAPEYMAVCESGWEGDLE
jgi:hypothetical protein